MQEILYIQAGNFSGYVGSHFWNTQESYFTYEEDKEPLVSHDISFREGLIYNSEPVLNPRILVFDHKKNFGALSRDIVDEAENPQSTWSGNVDTVMEQPVPKSSYHAQLEAEDGGDKDGVTEPLTSDKVRYWSDFSRVYYAPKSIHPVPVTYESEPDDEWNAGKAAFHRYNEDTELMENAARSFIEECDNLQGVQIINDTAVFGSFIDCFFTVFQDDFGAKLSSTVIPILSKYEAQDFDPYNADSIKKTLNNALCLRSLAERASLVVPVRHPSVWSSQMNTLGWSLDSPYHTSALLSAHVETCTLPLRLKKNATPMVNFTHRLGGTSPFAALNGVFPVQDTLNPMMAFSVSTQLKNMLPSASIDVTRGFSEPLLKKYKDWQLNRGLPDTLISSTHTEPYPLPTSFPSLKTASASTSVFTTVTSTPALAPSFSAFARYVDDCVKWKRGIEVLGGIDEMLELKEDLLNLVEKIRDGWESDSDENEGDE